MELLSGEAAVNYNAYFSSKLPKCEKENTSKFQKCNTDHLGVSISSEDETTRLCVCSLTSDIFEISDFLQFQIFDELKKFKEKMCVLA